MECFQVSANKFPGNKRAENYRKLVEDILKAYKYLDYHVIGYPFLRYTS